MPCYCVQDDSIEFRSVPAHLGSCDVVELKREGLGLDKELFDTVTCPVAMTQVQMVVIILPGE